MARPATLAIVRSAGAEVPWAEEPGSEETGVPVVLLAGLGWRASGCVRSGWLAGGPRVVALDWPRRWPRRRLDTVAAVADVFAGALEELGILRAHLAGVSAGGMVALQLAADRPRLAASLALVSTTAVGGRVNGRWRVPASRAVAALLPPEPFHGFYRRWGPALVGTTALTDRLGAARLWTDPMGRRKMSDLLAAIWRFDARSRLGSVRTPALVVHGARDAILPWSAAEELARGLPDARLARVEDGTHFVFLTHRARVVGELRRLWNRKEEER